MTKVFVICTMQQAPRPGVTTSATWSATLNLSPGMTRADLFTYVIQEGLPEHLRGGVVLFYSADPLHLPGPAVIEAVPAGSES